MREIHGLLDAQKCSALSFPKTKDPKMQKGLVYEKKVTKALNLTAKKCGAKCESQTWFKYFDRQGLGYCAIDNLFTFGDQTLVIEVKYTWVSEAEEKLFKLYLPVVFGSNNFRARPLIICRNITPTTPPRINSLSQALKSFEFVPVFQWLGTGAIPWV